MNKSRLFLVTWLLATLSAVSLHAADLAGKWTAEFDSPIGQQKYVYEFKTEGDKLTGTATYDHSMGKGTVALQAIKVDGDKLTFNEPLNAQGMEITINYDGTITDNELKLTRHVGDFGTEQVVAHRASDAHAH